MIGKALSFDDVLLVPQHQFGGSRSECNTSTTVAGVDLSIPILSANMSTVTEKDMIKAMSDLGGIGVIHRMCSFDEQAEHLKTLYPKFISIEGSYAGITRFRNHMHSTPGELTGACIDVAHADSPEVIDTIKTFREEFLMNPLIVGNYATQKAIDRLFDAGVDLQNNIAFKVGIGSGSHCTTRIVTGCGLPTFESILRIRKFYPDICLIADGGIKNSGDAVKALAAGADAVMLGSILAGTFEAPGNVIKHQGKLYKIYRGSASFGQKFEVNKKGYVEGEESSVPYKGHVETVIHQFMDGIRSGMSYCGARSIGELQNNAEFVEISNSGYRESLPHGAI